MPRTYPGEASVAPCTSTPPTASPYLGIGGGGCRMHSSPCGRTSAVRWTGTYRALGGRAVLRALLLGDRSRITDAQRARFTKTGLMHLLAVSGLHVFLVGMVLYALLRPFLLRLRLRWRTAEVVRAALTITVLVFYMLLTGGRPSVVRAVIMATLFIGGIFFQRSAHSLNTLGVAALVLLAVRPPMLFDVGFQLSMAAVSGIVTLNPRFLEMLPDRYRTSEALDWVLSTGTTSAAAILGTAPVLLYHFGWVSVAGLLLNMVGIPCTGLALTSAIATVAVGGLWPTAAASFGSAADVFLQGLLATSRYGAAWFSWAGIRMATPDLWELTALGAGLIAVAQWPRPRLRWRWIVIGGLFMTASVWGPVVGGGTAPTLDIVFFDVGQGDAALLKTPSDHHVLIDAGPRSPSGATAEFAVLPFLRRWGFVGWTSSWSLILMRITWGAFRHSYRQYGWTEWFTTAALWIRICIVKPVVSFVGTGSPDRPLIEGIPFRWIRRSGQRFSVLPGEVRW